LAWDRGANGPYGEGMGRILLIAAVVVVGFFLLGSVLGFIVSLLKWALLIGAVAVIAAVVLKLFRTGRGGEHTT
jgi:hypothetical protein